MFSTLARACTNASTLLDLLDLIVSRYPWSQDEDSEDEDDDEAAAAATAADAATAAARKAEADAAKAAPKRKLPSALDALNSGGSKPSFLQRGKDEFEVLELKARKMVDPEAPEEPPPLAPPLKKPRDASTPQVQTTRE